MRHRLVLTQLPLFIHRTPSSPLFKGRLIHSTAPKMALPPKFAGLALRLAEPKKTGTSVPTTTHTLEVYLDYVCPFSAKIFSRIMNDVVPLLKNNPAWADALTIIFRPQVQPWHPSSTLVHEAALAVLQVQPDKFWDFSAKLFEEQKDYFDVNVVNETRNNTYKRLAKVAAKAGVDEDKIYQLLVIPEKPGDDGSLNSGNGVTTDMKLVTKMNRLIGVHVTPTGVFDGVVQDIGSSWDANQWKEWLENNVV